MKDYITQIGVGGVFAIVVIKTVLDIVLSKRNDNKSYVTLKELERLKNSVQYKDNCEQIVKRLDETNKMQEKRFDKVDAQFEEVKSLIRNGGK